MPGPGDVEARMARALQPPAPAPERQKNFPSAPPSQEELNALAVQPGEVEQLGTAVRDDAARLERALTPPAPAGTMRREDLVSPGMSEPETPGTVEDPQKKAALQAIQGSDVPRFESGLMGTLEQRATVSEQQGDELASTLEAIEGEIRTSDLKAVERQFAVAEAQRARLEQMDQGIRALQETQFDASRLFAGADGATRFGAHLGIAVGHMLQIRNNILFPGSNTPNAAMQIINQAIDRDIRTQLAQHQQGLSVLAQQRSAMGLAREIGLTEAAAESFAREKMLESVQRQLTTLAFRHRGTQQALLINQTINQLGLQRAEVARAREIEMQLAMLQAGRSAGNDASDVFVNPLTRYVDFGPGVDNEAAANAALDRMKEIAGAGAVSELFDRAAAARTFEDGIDQLLARIEGHGGLDVMVGRRAAAIQTDIKSLMFTFMRSMGAGAMDRQTEAIFDNMLNNPADATTFVRNFVAQAEALRLGTTRTMQGIAQPLVDALPAARFTRRAIGDRLAEDRVERGDEEEIGSGVQELMGAASDALNTAGAAIASGGTVPTQLLPGANN